MNVSLESLDAMFAGVPDDLLEVFEREAPRELNRRVAGRKLELYKPYPKQIEFHSAGAGYRERLLSAGNQLGKTLCAAAETTMHLTQRYPDWWTGRVFQKPSPWWVAGVTSESTRDNPQRLLMGRNGEWGTGMIPKDALADDPSMKRGVPGAVDGVIVRFGGGGDVQAGESSIGFKSYDQGREKFQGETLGGVWLDEEPDADIYTECLTRTNLGLGPILLTFTPLLGVTEVVRRFLIDKVPGTHVTMMTIDDAEHFSAEERAAIIASYPPFERDSRTKGIPMRGSGAVFPISLDDILCDSFQIPGHWRQICAIDFGWSHPSAGVRLVHDADSDVIYVIAEHRAKEQTPLMFAGAVKGWGAWLPWAWPHDGHASGGKFGAQDQKQLAAIYKGHGLKMLGSHSTFQDGTMGVEAGIAEMNDRLQTGRLKVFKECRLWQEEFNLYHRDDGLIVKENDDLLAATRYAIMMRRYAVPAKLTVTVDPEHQTVRHAYRADGLGWMGIT